MKFNWVTGWWWNFSVKYDVKTSGIRSGPQSKWSSGIDSELCWGINEIWMEVLKSATKISWWKCNSWKNVDFLSAAAAKLHQSCPAMCSPIDGSPPGSSVSGILQARTLEWGAIAFSNFYGSLKLLILVTQLSQVKDTLYVFTIRFSWFQSGRLSLCHGSVLHKEICLCVCF